MLCTKQKVLRRFWYATVPVDTLADGPKPFTLLGEKIVMFLDNAGKPVALADRCCHRTARLSKGWSQDGRIICGYHGWTYDGTGKLVRIPQLPPDQPLPDAPSPRRPSDPPGPRSSAYPSIALSSASPSQVHTARATARRSESTASTRSAASRWLG